MNQKSGQRIAVGTAAVLVSISFAGCASVLGGQDHSTEQPASMSPSPSSETTSDPQPQPTTQASTAQPRPEGPSSMRATPPGPTPTASQELPAEKPIANRRATLEGSKVLGSLFAVQRNGRMAVVNLRITKINSTDAPFRLRTLLNDGDPEVGARNASAVDGLRLLDGKAEKLYIPATTASGTCLCSPASNSVFDKYDELMVSVVFAAPPAEVGSVDVLIPLFGTVSNVPVR